jgi:hypothetical protein
VKVETIVYAWRMRGKRELRKSKPSLKEEQYRDRGIREEYAMPTFVPINEDGVMEAYV